MNNFKRYGISNVNNFIKSYIAFCLKNKIDSNLLSLERFLLEEADLDNTVEKVLDSYYKMKEIYKEDNLILLNPYTYFGYNLENGKEIVLEIREL